MKKSFCLLIMVLQFTLGDNLVCAQPKGHLIIAILDFRNTGTDKTLDHFQVNIPELLTTFLARNQKLHLVERLALEKVIRELYIQVTDNFESKLRNERGKLRGANIVLVGSFFNVNDKKAISISARFVCVETGEIKLAEQMVVKSPEKMLDSLKKMAMLFEKKLLQCNKCCDDEK